MTRVYVALRDGKTYWFEPDTPENMVGNGVVQFFDQLVGVAEIFSDEEELYYEWDWGTEEFIERDYSIKRNECLLKILVSQGLPTYFEGK